MRGPGGKLLLAGYASDAAGRHQVLIVRLTANGSLDPSFGSDGVLLRQLGSGSSPASTIYALALGRAGAIIAVGAASDASGRDQGLVLRLTRNGMPDDSFGVRGVVRRRFAPGPRAFAQLTGAVVQRDGKIVVTGPAFQGGPAEVMVARLKAAGANDPSFGTRGVGISQHGYGTRPASATDAVAQQPDGKLVLAGIAFDAAASGQRALVIRIRPSGRLDPAFGAGGVVRRQLGSSSNALSQISDFVLDHDGRLVLAGPVSDTAGQTEAMVARLTPSGRFDRTFGRGGVVRSQLSAATPPFSDVSSVAVQRDGKIVAAGVAVDSVGVMRTLVLRLTGSGHPDDTFGRRGAVLTPLGAAGTNPRAEGTQLLLRPDGKIVLAGLITDVADHLEALAARLL